MRGLRARSAVAFAAMALVLSIVLSTATYQLARWYLLDKREALATRQVTLNALVVKGQLAGGEIRPSDVLDTLRSTTNARAVLRVDGTWYAVVVQLSQTAVPTSLLSVVATNGAGHQRAVVNGEPYLIYGITIPGRNAQYYEFVSAEEYARTMSVLARVLLAAASVTTLGGAAAGWLISRRLIRPLSIVGASARAISAGDLSHRLDDGDDPDLHQVASSFNEMASSLEERIERERRFTADVSHELRTPLTAMGSAVSLARRSDLSERGVFAMDVLEQQLQGFRRLTLELLEISRIDAGIAALDLTDIDVATVITAVMAQADCDPALFDDRMRPSGIFPLDGTRFERVVANLVENADRYAGGIVAITTDLEDDHLVVTVDDAGPGVPEDERTAIFGRFNRGSRDQPIDKPKGTGLGLSLVDEHVRLHGGTVEVTGSPFGGARFVVRIPRGVRWS
jgi:two-component system sensor histidine kinase MtrB